MEFEFGGQAANDLIDGDTLKLSWTDGDLTPDPSRIPLPQGMTKFPVSGGIWIGTKGSILKPYTVRPFVMPESSFPAEKYPKGFGRQDHYHDWVDAILQNGKSCADFAHAARLTETVLLGTLAEHAPGQWLEWDRSSMTVPHRPELNAHIKRPYRNGWQVEGLG
ncbi:hypothetical protein [Verrucomicrobium spinosum]|uniref:hypothetical protein n=1 Tax=Verrucomicrobium spinosum TaxID=2736 RepID=UPI0009EC2EFA|nr:hypothetical protein [Verrucomicrobium spinosum]